MKYTGGCHCGAVSFAFECPEVQAVTVCNCSICHQAGYLHITLPQTAFKLLSDPKKLSTYTFNTHAAKHTFCKICGIKSFYYPRSYPDGVSINARCVHDLDLNKLSFNHFDGQNWEENIAKLRDND